MQRFGWTKAAILTTTESVYNLPATTYLNYLRSNGIEVPVFGTFSPGTVSSAPGSKKDLLQQVKDAGLKIVLIFSYGGDIRDILLSAKEMEMLSGYAYAGLSIETTYYRGADDWYHECFLFMRYKKKVLLYC